MARLVDTFSSELLDPFNSKKTCLNNFSSYKNNGYQPVIKPFSNYDHLKFSFVLQHPVHVKEFKFLVPTTVNYNGNTVEETFFSNQFELDPITSKVSNFAISFNNVRVNTVSNFCSNLNSLLYRPTNHFERACFGDGVCRYNARNSTNGITSQPQLTGTYYFHNKMDKQMIMPIPLGIFCDLFNQDVILPDNTLIEIEFDSQLLPISKTITDNFAISAAAKIVIDNTFRWNECKLIVPQRLVARENLNSLETKFFGKFREFIPLWSSFLNPSQQSALELASKQKITIPLQHIPEFLVLWVNYGLYTPKVLDDGNARIVDILGFTGNTVGRIYASEANPSSLAVDTVIDLKVENLFNEIISLCIDLNGTKILDYDYKRHRQSLSMYLADDLIHGQLPDKEMMDVQTRAPYIINLATSGVDQSTGTKLTGGTLSVAVVFSRTFLRNTFTSSYFGGTPTYSFNIWGAMNKKIQIDSWRRTFVESF
jgi:hypothetical protein